MKIKKLNMQGFSHDIFLLLFVVVFAVAGVGYIVASHASPAPQTASFTGTITQDGCATSKLPIGDVGCSITVNGKVVIVAHGNAAAQPWGSVIGFSPLTANYTGRSVSVYAAIIYSPASIHYTLQGSSAYYVRLLPNQPQDPIPSYIKGFIYLKSSGGANCGNSCPPPTSQPYQATVAVKTAGGAPVKSFTSASNGSFSVTLVAGTYVLVPQSYGSGNINAPRQTVTVSQGGTTNINIYYTSITP
jgi:hypothetical protein